MSTEDPTPIRRLRWWFLLSPIGRVVTGIVNMTTAGLASIPFLLGFILLGAWTSIANRLFPTGAPAAMPSLVLSCTAFLWGIGGVVFIARKEVPQLITIRGNAAVAIGVLWVVVLWGFAAFALARAWLGV